MPPQYRTNHLIRGAPRPHVRPISGYAWNRENTSIGRQHSSQKEGNCNWDKTTTKCKNRNILEERLSCTRNAGKIAQKIYTSWFHIAIFYVKEGQSLISLRICESIILKTTDQGRFLSQLRICLNMSWRTKDATKSSNICLEATNESSSHRHENG